MKLVDINNYWLHRFDYLEKDYPICFVCGKRYSLEKCHLIPRALGGSDNVENLVLLCIEHHKKAPNIGLGKEIMLNWIERENEKYSTCLNFNCEDIEAIRNSVYKISARLEKVVEDSKGLEQIEKFLERYVKENAIFIASHPEANIRTHVMLYDYIAKMDSLEMDYLKFLVSSYR